MSKSDKNTIYKITLLNWKKHNPDRKKHYKYTLIANNMIHDAKLNSLPVPVRWMWLNLLLIAGDMSRDVLEISKRQLRDMLESSWSIERALDSFQSFQMLTWEIEKVPPPPNRIEENRIELLLYNSSNKILESTNEHKMLADNILITNEANKQQQQDAHNSYNSTKTFENRIKKSGEYSKFRRWLKKNKELWSFNKFDDCIFENFETFEDFKIWFDEKTSESIDAISKKQQDFDPEKNPNDKKSLAKYLYKIIENELFIGKYG